ncbi:MAG: hypothetical protein R3E00_05485 [Paracoccaceae bacterium]
MKFITAAIETHKVTERRAALTMPGAGRGTETGAKVAAVYRAMS